jgi:hypothetical protein
LIDAEPELIAERALPQDTAGREATMRCLTLDECRQWRDEYSRRREWKRQSTCVTPLKRLPWYTVALIEQFLPFDRALLIVDQVVFDVPPKLDELRRACSMSSARSAGRR